MGNLREWPDDNHRWVIVYNMESLVTPIRHIVRIEDGVPYFEDEFQAWYYDKYRKLDGDEFAYCLSTKAMKEKETQIIKEYDVAMSKEERRKNWKAYCESNHEKAEENK